MTRRRVSLFAILLLRLAARREDAPSVIADLEDEAEERARTMGPAAARRWTRQQVAASVVPLLRSQLEEGVVSTRRTLMSVWSGVGSDLRLAVRRLWHAPGFTAICVATLALGIGGNIAVFTLVDRVLLERLPVPRPSELYRLGDRDDCCVNSGLPGSFSLFSYDLYRHLRDAAPEFRQLAAFQANVRAVTLAPAGGDAPGENLTNVFVSGNYFQMLELVPAAGRLIQPSDDQPDAPTVAVLSHRAWVERFSGRADVIGTAVTLNGVPATIVGVAPRGFYGETLRPNPAEIWVPLANEPRLQPAARLLEAKPSHWLYVIGRVPRGVDVVPLQPRLTATVQQWVLGTLPLSPDERQQVPRQHIAITSAAAGISSMRDEIAPPLKLLQVLAVAVLLIACANLANLLLVRGLARGRETAVHVALGAPRGRLAAQFLAEGVLLAAAGGAVGLGLSALGARAIVSLMFRGAPTVPIDASPSVTVVAFAVLLSIATGALFGIAPAWLASRSHSADALRGARTTAEGGSRMRRSLIALQVAMSLVLIACAGLLGRSLERLQTQDFGFRVEDRYIADLGPGLSTIPMDRLAPLYAALQERLRGIPGVDNAAFSLYAPMSGDNWSGRILVEGHDDAEKLAASWNRVSPRYFDTIGTPVLRGRAIDERDTADAPHVAVISQTFARRFFGDRDPIGRHIGFANMRGGGTRDVAIVGIVADVKYQDARADAYPTFFMPFLQGPRMDRSQYPQALEIQASAAPSLAADLRRELAAVDTRLTLRGIRTLEEQVAQQFNLDRLVARLGLTFGAVALLLACLGLYGLMAQTVTRRTREIGIRMAVGASRPQVLVMVLKTAMRQIAIGLALGVPCALIAGRLLQSTLFGVSGHDPVVLAGAAATLIAAAAVAALIPARHAATIDPVRALRFD